MNNRFSSQQWKAVSAARWTMGLAATLACWLSTTYCFPGFSAHDELLELTKAGLTPLDALRAATTVPADYLGMRGEIGTVAEGAYADLVMLERNPLENTAHTQTIEAVVLRGKLFDRLALDKLLASMEMPQGPRSILCYRAMSSLVDRRLAISRPTFRNILSAYQVMHLNGGSDNDG
jgi:hypothetical protein